MKRRRWVLDLPPDELGAVVHGPIVLGRSAGVVVAARCVFGHPTGLHLPIVMMASGIYAQAAQRQSGREYRPQGYEPSEPPRWSTLELRAEVNGKDGEMQPFASTSSSSDETYVREDACWINELPTDGVLRLVTAWPQIGLAPSTVVATFEGLAQAVLEAIPLVTD